MLDGRRLNHQLGKSTLMPSRSETVPPVYSARIRATMARAIGHLEVDFTGEAVLADLADQLGEAHPSRERTVRTISAAIIPESQK